MKIHQTELLSMVVLYVDSDTEDFEIFCEAVRYLNMDLKPIHVLSCEQALQLLRHITPDIIFLEINLPGMNGIDTLTGLRKIGKLRHVQVVIYSNSLYPHTPEELQDLGASHTLLKQHNFPEICDGLKALLETTPGKQN